MKIDAPNVLEFTDFRRYLSAYVDHAKTRNRRWSLGAWAQKVDLKGATCISRILNGRRPPSVETAQKFIDYFGFEDREAQHFMDLIQVERLKGDPQLREMLQQRIARRVEKPEKVIRDEYLLSELVAGWQHFAILEMADLPDFSDDPEWIVRRLRFKTTPNEAKKALERLVAFGFLTRTESGRYLRNVPSVSTLNDVGSKAMREYHHRMLANASDALEEIPSEEREFQAWGAGIPLDLVPEIKKLCREFRKEVKTLIHMYSIGRPNDEVYQFQIQFFPLTQKNPGRRPAKAEGDHADPERVLQ